MAKEYDISRPAGQCCRCDRQLEPGEEFVATVRGDDQQLCREDYCKTCWQAAAETDPPDRLGIWRTRVPPPQAKPRRRFVDDEMLGEFFRRLEGAEEPARVGFRFVVALLLMRRKLLIYDCSARDAQGREVWTMHFKGADGQPWQVINPQMDDEKIAQVSEQLGQILEGEL